MRVKNSILQITACISNQSFLAVGASYEDLFIKILQN